MGPGDREFESPPPDQPLDGGWDPLRYILLAMPNSKIESLGRVPLFARCSIRELEFIAGKADEVAVAAGQELIRQGRPADSFFVLLEGAADVDIDGRRRRTLNPGDFFGEISMLDRGPATATVVASAPSRLMVMSHAQFRDAVKGNDELLSKVMAAMGERLRADMLAREGAES